MHMTATTARTGRGPRLKSSRWRDFLERKLAMKRMRAILAI